jgi:hypothetical protein
MSLRNIMSIPIEIANLGIACVKVAGFFDTEGGRDDLLRWDSQERICRTTGLSRSGVQVALRELNAAGHLFTTRAHFRGAVRTLYWIGWRLPAGTTRADLDSTNVEVSALSKVLSPAASSDVGTRPCAEKPARQRQRDPVATPERAQTCADAAHVCKPPFLLEDFSNGGKKDVQVRAPDVCSRPQERPKRETPEARAARLDAALKALPPEAFDALKARAIAANPTAKHPRFGKGLLAIGMRGLFEADNPAEFPEIVEVEPREDTANLAIAPAGPSTPVLLDALDGLDESGQRRALPHLYGRLKADPEIAAASGRMRAVFKTILGDEHSRWLHAKFTARVLDGTIPGDKAANLVRDTLSRVGGSGPDRPDPIGARIYFGKACAGLFEDYGVALAAKGGGERLIRPAAEPEAPSPAGARGVDRVGRQAFPINPPSPGVLPDDPNSEHYARGVDRVCGQAFPVSPPSPGTASS